MANNNNKGSKGSIFVIAFIVFLALYLIGSCGGGSSSSSSSSGGKCRFCGNKTSWTYKGGGWVCYSCDKKYYNAFIIPEI